MAVLTSVQRSFLETTVTNARKYAETGAYNALQALAVNNPEPFAHMDASLRSLRNRLRHKARLLGDVVLERGEHQIDHLAYELAYEYWHQMLFAKYLEANDLLIHTSGVSVSMADCEELAADEGFTDKWAAAAAYASKMLPAIFRPDDPLMQVGFATEDRLKLEGLLDSLEEEHFTADDSLGWVYQFWQSDAKAKINASGDKIDGEKLPAVTQLFTEPYMVNFLIDNTLGAWWVSRNPGTTPPVKFEYLRFLEDGTPAAGKFEGWPDKTAEVTSLDPCMGSGHFVASLFPVFAKLRMHEEGLTKEEATDKVITENLHGLELDARCTQIAAFNLALTAWKFCGHYKVLPEMHLACSGIAPKGKKEDWIKLVGKVDRVEDKARMENGMEQLYDLFQLAPELGSLLDPSTIRTDAFTASFEELQPVLIKALGGEEDKDQIERGVVAAGIAKAGELLAQKYTLQITNVPYLSRGKQNTVMADYCGNNYPEAKGDLATVFFEKMLKSNVKGGISCSVIPQNWVFLTSYKSFREKLLKNARWNLIALLGAKSFQTPMWDFNVMLISLQHLKPDSHTSLKGLDVSEAASAAFKDNKLQTAEVLTVNQLEQLKNPDARVVLEDISSTSPLLEQIAESGGGASSFDSPRFMQLFWEQSSIDPDIFELCQSSPAMDNVFSGRSTIFRWENGKGGLYELMRIKKEIENYSSGIWSVWSRFINKKGVCVGMMGELAVSLYDGRAFDNNTGVIIPNNESDLLAIWAYCSSDNYRQDLRKIDKKLNVTSGTLVKVPFDLKLWQKVAQERYPNGLPKPYSNDATQWLFHGHPIKAEAPLQVATARMLGYRWPAGSDNKMDLADEARELITAVKAFDELTDEDGILCIPSVNGEMPAADRLREYLQAVYGAEYTTHTIEELLQREGSKKANLDEWLRDEFFEQHCRLFKNRPFVWHIWDGRKDGFSALVNYHKLTKKNLQKLIYTYLGDWIRHCEQKRKNGESGADGLLMAANTLKDKLELILEGEAPYDIFVRWKTLEQQPIGWDPDLNDGVRLNIRPFVEANVLRKKAKVKWGIDRGKNPAGSPWGEIRDNDMHLSLEEKRTAQANLAATKESVVSE
jgi:hypothetical protein